MKSQWILATIVAVTIIVIMSGLVGTGEGIVFHTEDSFDSDGVPQHLYRTWDDPASTFIPSADLQDRIALSLPEKKDIRNFNVTAIATDNQSNVLLRTNAEVFVTFLHDGAGFRNSFGYFTYYDGYPPGSSSSIVHWALFPNASYATSGGGLHLGDTVQLGGTGNSFSAGTRIGFFVVSDGWTGNPSDPVSVGWGGIHYSLRDLNTETDPALRPHFVLLHDEGEDGSRNLILGAEDFDRSHGSCDHDFNDVIFLLSTNPDDAMDTETMEVDDLVTDPTDTDNDDVYDENDEFPEDDDRAFYEYYPSKSTRGTLAFEDYWPSMGDFDFNDLVLRYRFTNVIDSEGKTKEVSVDAEIAAMGAGNANGFALLLPFAPALTESAVLSVKRSGEEVYTPDASFCLEASGTGSVAVLFDNAHSFITRPEGAQFANTERGTEQVTGAAFRLTVVLSETAALQTAPPYNPFLFRTGDRGIEIHLEDQPPSQFANAALFGTGDDDSDPVQGRYYRTAGNLPWALDLPTEWSHPAEQDDIVEAYPDIVGWAQSGGSTHNSWYLSGHAVSAFLYSP